jgi:alpha-methylacyl-CoA racemase
MTGDPTATGPLAGIKVVELAGLGPAPFACMWLADQGADVIRIDKAQQGLLALGDKDLLNRSRRSVIVDLKQAGGTAVVRRLAEQADVLVEGFRPGVAERLGLGPTDLLEVNPRLVYGRMTGWGQAGPLADRAGHDINYAALTGAIAAIGEPGRKPVPPLNLVADFGGGSMFLVAGILAALVERASSGRGQVVDAAMVDGASYLMAMAWTHRGVGIYPDTRGGYLLNGGAPYYDCYECADGEYVSVGALESQFFAVLVETLDREVGLADFPAQYDRDRWPEMRDKLAAAFRQRTRDAWAKVFAGVDACVAPVLWLSEVPQGEHLASRDTIVEVAGAPQPAPAPRFSRTPGQVRRPPSPYGADTEEALQDWGFSPAEVSALEEAGTVIQA